MLKVNEIFFDIQRNTAFPGFPGIFVHLSGGKPGSLYTAHRSRLSIKADQAMTIESICEEISKYNCPVVIISGEEPLLQSKTSLLISRLVDKYIVILETSGMIPVENINRSAIINFSVNCSESDSFDDVFMENLHTLQKKDFLKFIISKERDYNRARDLLNKRNLFESCNIMFIANEKHLSSKTLADWIISDQLHVRLGFHVEKLLMT